MRAIVISGLSGSGKSSAVGALEDAGYYCIDNLPVPLLKSFLDLAQSAEEIQKLAVVMDSRNRTYIKQLPQTLKQLCEEGHSFELVFLEASDQVLARRFSETRRKHPLAAGDSVLEGIKKERELLEPLFTMASFILDTSELKAADLRKEMIARYGGGTDKQQLSLQVTSFGFKYGIPLNADMVLDVRFLPNPFFKEELKKKTGTDPEVIQYVMSQKDTEGVLDEYRRLFKFLIPRFDREGKSYLTIAVGCTGGKHRSVVLAAKIAEFVKELGYQVTVMHRDLERE
jgi:RNase adapter protein RapZ